VVTVIMTVCRQTAGRCVDVIARQCRHGTDEIHRRAVRDRALLRNESTSKYITTWTFHNDDDDDDDDDD